MSFSDLPAFPKAILILFAIALSPVAFADETSSQDGQGNQPPAEENQPAAEENQDTDAEVTITDEDAVALVKQLGDPDFRTREEASRKLVEIGAQSHDAVQKAVQAGVGFPDPEIRLRCERILAVIEYKERWRLVEAFEKDVDGKKGVTLPGWERFKAEVSDKPNARELFVKMFKAEDELISTAAKKPKEAAGLFTERCMVLQQQLRVFQQNNNNYATAALLFVANNDEVNVPDNMASQLYSFCSQANFSNALLNGDDKDLYRRLLGKWVANGEGNLAYQRLLLALRYELPEGVDSARSMLGQGNRIPQHYRQYAVLAVAKMGEEKDIEIIEPVLTDTTRVSARVVNRKRYDVQLRDVALAATIHLAGEDPKKFGFEDLQTNTQYLFNTSTLGFENEESRTKAFESWKKFREENAQAEPAEKSEEQDEKTVQSQPKE